jgi:hypothetical protein
VTYPSDPPQEELARLRGCLSDLASIMGLWAGWRGIEPPQIASTLCDALVGMLDLAFVAVQVSDPESGSPRYSVRIAPRFEGRIAARQVTDAITTPAAGTDSPWQPPSD